MAAWIPIEHGRLSATSNDGSPVQRKRDIWTHDRNPSAAEDATTSYPECLPKHEGVRILKSVLHFMSLTP